MRVDSLVLTAAVIVLASHAVEAQPFATPLYINMGGPEVVDSFGRTWLGDQGAGDPLGIRPDDAGGPNVIEAWCAPSAESISSLVADTASGLTFNPAHAGDTRIFQSIRWDNGSQPPDYILEIPVDPGTYTTSLYFCESCCPQRHAKLLVQGEVAVADLSVASYAGGATQTPGLHTQENVIVGDDGILNITLLGCPDPECPGSGDTNPVLTAVAVVPSGFDLCAAGFGRCLTGVSCTVDDDGNVAGSFQSPPCGEPTGYEVFQDGTLIATLPGDASGFSAVASARLTEFTVRPTGDADCAGATCTVLREDVCPRDFDCVLDAATGQIDCSWTPPSGAELIGYEVHRGGEKIADLDASAVAFTDVDPLCTRASIYRLEPVYAGDFPCAGVDEIASVIQTDCGFTAPVRINMGGQQTVDSLGRVWLGDRTLCSDPENSDPLDLRPDDQGGAQAICDWTVGILQPDSMVALGLDPTHPGDLHIFNTIRWDNAGDAADFIMELPLDPGTYDVNMWFNEQCCNGRNFKIQLQGSLVDDDVSYLDYDPANPAFGRLGMFGYSDILVLDVLRVALLPCPECPRPPGAGVDNNAIIDALEILRTGDLPDGVVVQLAGDCNQDGAQDLSDLLCSVNALFPGFVLTVRSRETPCASDEGTAALLDVNGDGVFNAADLMSYAAFFFSGGAAPAQGIACGPVVAPGCAAGAACR